MLTKRLIACFDMIGGRVTKAYQFFDNIDIAPAAELAKKMCADGIDEIIFFDITASNEKRSIDIETIRSVAKNVTVPCIVGGGIATLDDMAKALNAGAKKISIDSMAVRNPDLIIQGVKEFGAESIVLSTQVKREPKMPSGYEVYIDGARVATGIDGIEWIKRGEGLGAGEICINSIDGDGTLQGYDMELMKLADKAVKIPLIASGGAGAPEHLRDVFTQTATQGAIISSMLYSPRMERNYSVEELKDYLLANNIPVRRNK